MSRKRENKFKGALIALLICILFVFGVYYFNHNDNDKNMENSVHNKVNNKKEESEKKVEPKRMSLVAVGDCLLHDSIYMDAKTGENTYDFTKLLEQVEPLIKDYDLKFYNQESIIGGKDLGLSNYPTFNSPDEIGDDMIKIGFNMVSLANNHSLDKGERGILYSNKYWKSKDVITAGTYSSFEERNHIPIYEQNDIKYAYLAYTTVTNGLKAPEGKEYLLNVYSDDQVKNDINQIKDKVDVIIVSMHWGVEYTSEPPEEERQIASYLSSLGVNLIIGNHAHVIQPVDYVNDTLVMYALGNFVASQRILGVDKAIGLLAGLDIVVDEGKVTFENINYHLLYTSYNPCGTNYRIIPFENLDDSILPNYQSIEKQMMGIVNTKVSVNNN